MSYSTKAISLLLAAAMLAQPALTAYADDMDSSVIQNDSSVSDKLSSADSLEEVVFSDISEESVTEEQPESEAEELAEYVLREIRFHAPKTTPHIISL